MPDPSELARLLDPAQDPPRARYGHLAAPYVLPWQDRTDAARAALAAETARAERAETQVRDLEEALTEGGGRWANTDADLANARARAERAEAEIERLRKLVDRLERGDS